MKFEYDFISKEVPKEAAKEVVATEYNRGSIGIHRVPTWLPTTTPKRHANTPLAAPKCSTAPNTERPRVVTKASAKKKITTKAGGVSMM